jgi:hypothetical protein
MNKTQDLICYRLGGMRLQNVNGWTQQLIVQPIDACQ